MTKLFEKLPSRVKLKLMAEFLKDIEHLIKDNSYIDAYKVINEWIETDSLNDKQLNILKKCAKHNPGWGSQSEYYAYNAIEGFIEYLTNYQLYKMKNSAGISLFNQTFYYISRAAAVNTGFYIDKIDKMIENLTETEKIVYNIV